MPLAKGPGDAPLDLGQQAKFFSTLARRVATLAKGAPTPCGAMPACGFLASLGYAWLTGLRGTAHLMHRTEAITILARRQAQVAAKPRPEMSNGSPNGRAFPLRVGYPTFQEKPRALAPTLHLASHTSSNILKI